MKIWSINHSLTPGFVKTYERHKFDRNKKKKNVMSFDFEKYLCEINLLAEKINSACEKCSGIAPFYKLKLETLYRQVVYPYRSFTLVSAWVAWAVCLFGQRLRFHIFFGQQSNRKLVCRLNMCTSIIVLVPVKQKTSLIRHAKVEWNWQMARRRHDWSWCTSYWCCKTIWCAPKYCRRLVETVPTVWDHQRPASVRTSTRNV